MKNETIEFRYLKMLDVVRGDLDDPAFVRWLIQTAVLEPLLTDALYEQLDDVIRGHLVEVITTETPYES